MHRGLAGWNEALLLQCIRKVARRFSWYYAIAVLSGAIDVQSYGDTGPEKSDEGENRDGYQDAHTG